MCAVCVGDLGSGTAYMGARALMHLPSPHRRQTHRIFTHIWQHSGQTRSHDYSQSCETRLSLRRAVGTMLRQFPSHRINNEKSRQMRTFLVSVRTRQAMQLQHLPATHANKHACTQGSCANHHTQRNTPQWRSKHMQTQRHWVHTHHTGVC